MHHLADAPETTYTSMGLLSDIQLSHYGIPTKKTEEDMVEESKKLRPDGVYDASVGGYDQSVGNSKLLAWPPSLQSQSGERPLQMPSRF